MTKLSTFSLSETSKHVQIFNLQVFSDDPKLSLSIIQPMHFKENLDIKKKTIELTLCFLNVSSFSCFSFLESLKIPLL